MTSLSDRFKVKDRQIGAQLRQLRMDRRVSLMTLSNDCDISHQMLQKYEKGKSRIALSTLLLFCEKLSISPVEFIAHIQD